MYRNLNAEMARRGIPKSEVAKAINRSYGAFLLKFNGKRQFTIEEAKAIKSKFFPDSPLEYLFEGDLEKGEEAA